MTLPIKTTLEDVDKVVGYLQNKPAGATVAEAKTVLPPKHLDGRKVRAYIDWGLVKEDAENKLRLDDGGWRLVRAPDSSADVYADVIDRIRPYRSAIEWMHHQGFNQVTVNDVAAYWIEHFATELGSTNEGTAKAAVTCFFNLAAGADLGNYLIGRKQQPTRLELDKAHVESFVAAGRRTPPWSDQSDGVEPDPTDEDMTVDPAVDLHGGDARGADESGVSTSELVPPPAPEDKSAPLRVFIAHGKNMGIVEQVETILGLSDVENEYAEAEESPAIPVPDKVLDAMRRCSAGIICVSVDEGKTDADGNYTINENVLIEIGAAFVLYERRVVLVWDRRLPVPSNLQGLYRCEFEGDDLNWDAGMKLMKAIKNFRMT